MCGSDSNASDQGKIPGEENPNELVVSATLIVKCYEENRSSGPKNIHSKRRSSSARKNAINRKDVRKCFNCGITDHFFMECKANKASQNTESYVVFYKKLLALIKKENISLLRLLLSNRRNQMNEHMKKSHPKMSRQKGSV